IDFGSARNSGSKVNVGAIVGGVVSGVLFLTLVIVTWFYLRATRRNQLSVSDTVFATPADPAAPRPIRAPQALSAFMPKPLFERNRMHRFVHLTDDYTPSQDITVDDPSQAKNPLSSSTLAISNMEQDGLMAAASQTIIMTRYPKATSDAVLADLGAGLIGTDDSRHRSSFASDQSLYPNPADSLHLSLILNREMIHTPSTNINGESQRLSRRAENGSLVSNDDVDRDVSKPEKYFDPSRPPRSPSASSSRSSNGRFPSWSTVPSYHTDP
ncbi:hypothetical protein K435DRAFT_785411, partial [Dendrothele bispora CBS 962.96]